MTTSLSSPLYLYLDTKTESYPSPAIAVGWKRTKRYTQFSFQTVNCDYFVDVTVFYSPETEMAVRDEVKIRITDMTDEGMGDDTKQKTFRPTNGHTCSVQEARRLADLHLNMYVQLN